MRKMMMYAQVLLGNALIALAFGSLIIPQGFASGGTTGLAMILLELVPLSLFVIVLIINAVLFVAGFLHLGKAFAVKTALCTFSFPYLLAVFEKFPITSLNPAFASVLAGVMLGAGTKLILEGGGNSGGFDVIGAMLNRRFGIPVWVVFYGIDALLIASQMISGGVMAGIYGIVVTVVACAINALVPFVHARHNQTKLA